MSRIIAIILSYIFNPVIFVVLMPYLLIYRQTTSISYALKWELFSIVFIFFGLVLVFMERRRGIFSDFDLSKREERWKFFSISLAPVALYLTASFFLKGLFFSTTLISIGIIAGLILFAFFNRFLKPSIHTGIACAYVLSVAILYGQVAFLVTFWTIPVIIWARIKLKKHTFNEVFVGGIIGTTVTLLTFLIGKYIYNL